MGLEDSKFSNLLGKALCSTQCAVLCYCYVCPPPLTRTGACLHPLSINKYFSIFS